MKQFSALLTLAVAATIALSACSSSSSSSSSTDTSASSSAASSAATDQTAASPASDQSAVDSIKQLADGVTSNFTEQQDKQLSDDAENTVWLSKVQIPKMPCTIVLLKKTSETMAPCSLKTTSQSEADADFAAAKANVTAALPDLKLKDAPNNGKYVNQALYIGDKTAVLILEQKKPDGSFMVSVGFSKPSFYNS